MTGDSGDGLDTNVSHSRSDYHPIRWLLLSGDRRDVALLLSGIILVSLVLVGTLWEIQMEILVNETRAVQTLFNTLLGGVILFVSVVLSINTAILAEEFGPLQTKQTQVEESIEFQSELERFVESGVSPADIGEFSLFVLQALRSEGEPLRNRVAGTENDALARELSDFLEDLYGELTFVEMRLRSRNRGVSSVLLAGLDYDYADHIHAARSLVWEYGDDLSESERRSLDNLVEILTLFASGREYFTTLYYKREVRSLSGSLLLLSLPVIVFTSFVLLAIDAGLFPTYTALGIQPRLLYVSLAFVVALSPYVLLTSYMLRIITVSKHSLEPSGFTIDDSITPD